MAQLGELGSLLNAQLKARTQILAVSPETAKEAQKLRAAVRKQFDQEIDFPLLADPESAVIHRYGLRNPEGRGWPHPAVYVIDRSGRVRWKFVETDYRIRPSNEEILKALEDLE